MKALTRLAERARMAASGRNIVYLHYAEEGLVDYVGKSTRGRARILEHLRSPRGRQLGWAEDQFGAINLSRYGDNDLKAVEQALIVHYGGASRLNPGTQLLNANNVFAYDGPAFHAAVARGRQILTEIGFPLRP